jgi:hypothetical protein
MFDATEDRTNNVIVFTNKSDPDSRYNNVNGSNRIDVWLREANYMYGVGNNPLSTDTSSHLVMTGYSGPVSPGDILQGDTVNGLGSWKIWKTDRKFTKHVYPERISSIVADYTRTPHLTMASSIYLNGSFDAPTASITNIDTYHGVVNLLMWAGPTSPLNVTGSLTSDATISHNWYIQVFVTDPLSAGKTIEEIATFMESTNLLAGTSTSSSLSTTNDRRYNVSLDGSSVTTGTGTGYQTGELYLLIKDGIGQIAHASQQVTYVDYPE